MKMAMLKRGEGCKDEDGVIPKNANEFQYTKSLMLGFFPFILGFARNFPPAALHLPMVQRSQISCLKKECWEQAKPLNRSVVGLGPFPWKKLSCKRATRPQSLATKSGLQANIAQRIKRRKRLCGRCAHFAGFHEVKSYENLVVIWPGVSDLDTRLYTNPIFIFPKHKDVQLPGMAEAFLVFKTAQVKWWIDWDGVSTNWLCEYMVGAACDFTANLISIDPFSNTACVLFTFGANQIEYGDKAEARGWDRASVEINLSHGVVDSSPCNLMVTSHH